MWPNPQDTAVSIKKSLMENFIFCEVGQETFWKSNSS